MSTLPGLCLTVSYFAVIFVSNQLFVLSCRLNFLSINRFERKKNIDLAISAFARLHNLQGNNLNDVSLTIAGKRQTPIL